MKGIIALRMCDMSKYGGLPLEYGTVPAPVWRNIHPRLQMGTAARARAGVGTLGALVTREGWLAGWLNGWLASWLTA